MSEEPAISDEKKGNLQADLNEIEAIVSSEFQIEQASSEGSVPTYYLRQPQETKQPFLRVLDRLEPMNLIAFLRREESRFVLRVSPKPETRRGNTWINWALLLATMATTLVTGYLLSSGTMDPLIGAATFTAAIMTVLGAHEMGHKLTAGRNGIDATPPYFIPGPPPLFGFLGIGTFGAVIIQKSLPRNRDSLFDIGASGPIVGFLLAIVAIGVGLPFSTYTWIPSGAATLPVPLLFELAGRIFPPSGSIPTQPSGDFVLAVTLHPVAFAGWVGLVVTMLNLLPVAMLDGGHVARALVGDRTRLVLGVLSFALLVVAGFLPMALFVLFMSVYKHPGPLDDVTGLSLGRKLMSILLVAVFVLSSYLHYFVLMLLSFLGS